MVEIQMCSITLSGQHVLAVPSSEQGQGSPHLITSRQIVTQHPDKVTKKSEKREKRSKEWWRGNQGNNWFLLVWWTDEGLCAKTRHGMIKQMWVWVWVLRVWSCRYQPLVNFSVWTLSIAEYPQPRRQRGCALVLHLYTPPQFILKNI